MKKTQPQSALKTLTKEEREQLAEWLRQGTYDTVLERVNKTRAEGGFDLHISISPLQTFYAKVALLDLINTKVPDDKKMTITQFESISAGEVLLASGARGNPNPAHNRNPNPDPFAGSSENQSQITDQKSEICIDVHDAIMEATHDLATSGDNTPTDLLALQRLADFPARADYRAHKVQMDLERAAQKKEMDEHRKRMNEERFDLAKRSLELREKALEARGAAKSNNSTLCTPNSALEDDLGPLASTLDEIEARATKKFCLPPLTHNHTHNRTPTQNPLSEAHDSGATTNSQESLSSSEPSSKTLSESSSVASAPPVIKNPPVPPLAPLTSVQSPSENPQSAIRIPQSLEDRVSQYTLARHYEAAHGKNPRIVGKYAAWNFKTKMQWCPCGNKSLPCPDHGDFPKYFWEHSPDNADYTAVLRAKKLPFIPHYQLLREQEEDRQRQQEAAEQPIPLSSSLPPLPLSESLSETLSSSSQENTEDSRIDADLQSGDDNEKARIAQAVSLTPELQSGVTTETNETTASAVSPSAPLREIDPLGITNTDNEMNHQRPQIHESKHPSIQTTE